VKIRLAERIGFCFGVKRAVAMAEQALKKNKKICSLGSIIHNSQVVEDLAAQGLRVIKDVSDIRKSDGCGAVVISSHGISPKIARQIKKKGVKIIDTTCPFVLNAQRIASALGKEGYNAIIVGDAGHPEVKALVDFAPRDTVVVRNKTEARALAFKKDAKISVLSQTTQSTENFLAVVQELLEKRPRELRVFNTICNDAEERQRLARELAPKVDLMLIVGGKHSANTNRLYEVCKKVLNNSHLIEAEREVRTVWFKDVRTVGITSGASTPDRGVQKVVRAVSSAYSKQRTTQ